jgi:hypothetical protein
VNKEYCTRTGTKRATTTNPAPELVQKDTGVLQQKISFHFYWQSAAVTLKQAMFMPFTSLSHCCCAQKHNIKRPFFFFFFVSHKNSFLFQNYYFIKGPLCHINHFNPHHPST